MSKALKLIEQWERLQSISIADFDLIKGIHIGDCMAEELKRLSAIEQAAIALIKCKGRYHAEQNTKALAAALGVELPQLDDTNVVDLNRPSAIMPLARSISDEMMDLADRLGSEFDSVDPRAWEHLLVYVPDYRDIAMDASRFRWLMADHKGDAKKAARSIIDTLAVSSLSSARLNIDANIEAVTKPRPSAIELQDAEIGIPEPVTELLNPV